MGVPTRWWLGQQFGLDSEFDMCPTFLLQSVQGSEAHILF